MLYKNTSPLRDEPIQRRFRVLLFAYMDDALTFYESLDEIAVEYSAFVFLVS
jgi:hypothetical protein